MTFYSFPQRPGPAYRTRERRWYNTPVDTSNVLAWYNADHAFSDRRFGVPATLGDPIEIAYDISGNERHMFPVSSIRPITCSSVNGHASYLSQRNTGYHFALRTYQHFPAFAQIAVAYSPATTWQGYGACLGRYRGAYDDRAYLFENGQTGVFHASPEIIQRRNGVGQSLGDPVNPIDQLNIYVFGHRKTGIESQWMLGQSDVHSVHLHILEAVLWSSLPIISVIEEWEQYFSSKYNIPLGV
jgi:hypothetical protein